MAQLTCSILSWKTQECSQVGKSWEGATKSSMNGANWHPRALVSLKVKPRQVRLNTTDFALMQSIIWKTLFKEVGGSSLLHHISVVNLWSSSLEIFSGSWLTPYKQRASLPQHLESRPTARWHHHTPMPGAPEKAGSELHSPNHCGSLQSTEQEHTQQIPNAATWYYQNEAVSTFSGNTNLIRKRIPELMSLTELMLL